MDNGFDKACPSNNTMIDGHKEEVETKPTVGIGNQFKDEAGIYWVVIELNGDSVRIEPAEDQAKHYTTQELFDEMEKL